MRPYVSGRITQPVKVAPPPPGAPSPPLSGTERLARAAAEARSKARRHQASLPPLQQQQQQLLQKQQPQPQLQLQEQDASEPSTPAHADRSPANCPSGPPPLITRASLQHLRKDRDRLKEANEKLVTEHAAIEAQLRSEASELLQQLDEMSAAQLEARQLVEAGERRVKELEEELATIRALHSRLQNQPPAESQRVKQLEKEIAELRAASQASEWDERPNDRFCNTDGVDRNRTSFLGRSGGFQAHAEALELNRLRQELQVQERNCRRLDSELGKTREVVQQLTKADEQHRRKYDETVHEMGTKFRKVMATMGKESIARRLMVHIVTPVVTLEGVPGLRGAPGCRREKLERVVREELLPACGDVFSSWTSSSDGHPSSDIAVNESEVIDQVTQELVKGLQMHMAQAEKDADSRLLRGDEGENVKAHAENTRWCAANGDRTSPRRRSLEKLE